MTNTDYQKEIEEILATVFSYGMEFMAPRSAHLGNEWSKQKKKEQTDKLMALLQQSNKESEKRGIDIAMHHMTKHTMPIHTNCELCTKDFEQLTHTDPDLEGRI